MDRNTHHFIEILTDNTLKYKMKHFDTYCMDGIIYRNEKGHVDEKSMNPDQLTYQKPAFLDLCCFQIFSQGIYYLLGQTQ